ncbi:unnamed protein product, partial [Heterosigma akashiwo]
MSNHRQLLQLLRSDYNRRCADCDAFLTDSSQIWACIEFGAFVCASCSAFHRQLGIHKRKDESVQFHNWTAKDVHAMSVAGNQLVNQIYERYVPPDWAKPGAEASPAEREFWV